jgi:hypothetical protein
MDERSVQAELDALDGDLFLDKEWDNGVIVYSIKHIIERGTAPYTALEWRDPEGRPLGLDESKYGLNIIQTLRSQEGSIKEALNEAIVHNAVLKEEARQAVLQEREDRLKWIEKSSKRLGLYGPWENKDNVA